MPLFPLARSYHGQAALVRATFQGFERGGDESVPHAESGERKKHRKSWMPAFAGMTEAHSQAGSEMPSACPP
jgi:hypothetical protein